MFKEVLLLLSSVYVEKQVLTNN